MFVFVDRSSALSLMDAGNFSAFKVVSDLPPDALRAALGPAGALKGESHVWVSQAWLRGHSAHFGEEWLSKLEAMLAYAAAKGWLDEKTGAILAHIE